MIDFRLNDLTEIELVDFGEESTDFVWNPFYPALSEVLSSDNAGRSGSGPSDPRATHKIKRAI